MIANITMAFTIEMLLGMVYQGITTVWPSGLADTVVDALFKKYVLQDLVYNTELRRELDASRMNK